MKRDNSRHGYTCDNVTKMKYRKRGEGRGEEGRERKGEG
jgi:hypothetical protein